MLPRSNTFLQGKHLKTGGLCAIKVIPWDEDELEDMQTEISILDTCKHPNIVSYFGTYFIDDSVWVRDPSSRVTWLIVWGRFAWSCAWRDRCRIL